MAEPPAPTLLDPAFAARVERLHSNLDAFDHYALLRVERTASTKEIKRAYFAIAPEFHPDRYFGKALGGLGAKMSAVFARLTVAYETLVSDESRAAYDEALGAVRSPSARPSVQPTGASVRPVPQPDAPSDSPPDPRPSTPEAERLRKLALARRLTGGGRPSGFPAAAPREPSPSTRAGPTIPPSPRPPIVLPTAAQRVMLADAAAREGHWDEAARQYQAAALAKGDDGALLEKTATAILRAGGDLRTAIDFARRALDLAPDRLDARLVLAEAYLVAGNASAAARELSIAKKLSPDDRRAALLAKRVK